MVLNPKFYIYSKHQAFSFPSTKKICHQTYNRLNNYHLIKAMLENPLIFLYLTERNAWEIQHFSKMQHNLPLFHVFFITVKPANSTGKILHRLHSIKVKSCPNCLGRSWKLPTEWPERQLHSQSTMFSYKQFWSSDHCQN